MLRVKRRVIAVVLTLLALAIAGSAYVLPAWALPALPLGGQVNNDPSAGINGELDVSGEDPTNADLTTGVLSASEATAPWAILRQQESSGARDQLFVRSFTAGAWSTRGGGTVGGRSSASPTFGGSLNFDQGEDGEAPAIDFAGVGRNVPWASWYEHTTGTDFANNNIFISRFDDSGDANQGKWIFAGQGRGTGGGTVPIPSINIHTDQNAENPAIAGGSTTDPSRPGPWVTWQETTTAPVNGIDQIFVAKPIGPGAINCDEVKPAGVASGDGHIPAIGGFCWQQTGVPRVGPFPGDPSLNIDPTRNAIEPDIAFAGANDSTPWVVWYEKDPSTLPGLQDNELVFAAKGISNGAAEGALQWTAVGSQRQGPLDTTGANHYGSCAESATNEQQCSLNSNPAADAESPRIAAGTMTPGNPTIPWVVWDERVAAVKQIFAARLVGSGAAAHFQLANGGNPISTGSGEASRPDIAFSANTPYVTWRQDTGGGVERAFIGHFSEPANPTFTLDESDVPLTPSVQADVREPIASTCPDNPFTQDGAVCPSAAVGSPFFLFTNGTSPRSLFADAFPIPAPETGNGGGAGGGGGGGGAPSPSNNPTPTPQPLPLTPTTNGTVAVGREQVSAAAINLPVTCQGGPTATCKLTLRLQLTETLRGHKVIVLTARRAPQTTHRVVILGSASITLTAGQSKPIRVGLNSTGKQLLASHRALKATLVLLQAQVGGQTSVLSTQIITLKGPSHKRQLKRPRD